MVVVLFWFENIIKIYISYDLMNMFVGVDPSINSTGVCVQFYDDEFNKLYNDKFYIVKGSKLTKREKKAELDNIELFEYVQYEKKETSDDNDNRTNERIKTLNFINIVNSVYDIVCNNYNKYNNDEDPIFNVYVCQEGISYGSTIRTRSVFDLAGLNYMLRMKFFNASNSYNINYIIATPGEIKKFATGVGNANKEVMTSVFKASYPELSIPKVDDVADAYFMASYARSIYEREC